MQRVIAHGAAALAAWLGMSSIGCVPFPALPEALDVAVSATEVAPAPIHSGPPGFSNAVWSLSRTGDPAEVSGEPPPGPYGGLLSGSPLARPPVGERIFKVQFDADGAMELVTENRYFLAEFYGATVPVREGWWPTTLPGVDFRSASYGLEVGDRFALAVLVQVRLGPSYVGRAILYSWGQAEGDHLSGTFGYLLDFDGGLLAALGQIADQYPVAGERLSE